MFSRELVPTGASFPVESIKVSGEFPLGRDAPEVGTVPAAANRQQRPQQPVKHSQHGGLG